MVSAHRNVSYSDVNVVSSSDFYYLFILHVYHVHDPDVLQSHALEHQEVRLRSLEL